MPADLLGLIKWAANRIRTDDDELAALRARVAELEVHRGILVGRCETWAREFQELAATSRARVAELEATNEELRRWIAQHEADRHTVDRALKDATDAAGTTSMHGQGRTLQPNVRDESVPPPGWILWWKDGDEQTPENIERADRAMRDGPLVTAIPIAQAWRFYDREHGYAPDIAAARADERAQCEREIAALCRAEADANFAAVDSTSDYDTKALLVGGANQLRALALRLDEGDYPRLPRSTDG